MEPRLAEVGILVFVILRHSIVERIPGPEQIAAGHIVLCQILEYQKILELFRIERFQAAESQITGGDSHRFEELHSIRPPPNRVVPCRPGVGFLQVMEFFLFCSFSAKTLGSYFPISRR